MRLPIGLPVSPMLARLIPDVPEADSVPGGLVYEPKWDGFRCIIMRDLDVVELSSRMSKSLTRYFPEIVQLVLRQFPDRCVVDAEIILRRGEPGSQRLDWDVLSQRIHPAASRIARLSDSTPAELVCFDLLALKDLNLTSLSYDERRAALETLFELIDPATGVHLTRATTDASVARDWFVHFEGAGLDGVMVKERRGSYAPGRREWMKVKHKRTAEAVVIGYREHARGHGVAALLLGMYDEAGELVKVGGISAFPAAMRLALLAELEPMIAAEGEGLHLPEANQRRRISGESVYVALRPELVVEVEFDQLEGRRFRHSVTLLRWRPDRDPRSCLLEQVDVAASYDLAAVLDEDTGAVAGLVSACDKD